MCNCTNLRFQSTNAKYYVKVDAYSTMGMICHKNVKMDITENCIFSPSPRNGSFSLNKDNIFVSITKNKILANVTTI